MAYDTCPTCGHTWHGLPCAANPNCHCPSPFDDDYWNPGDAA